MSLKVQNCNIKHLYIMPVGHTSKKQHRSLKLLSVKGNELQYSWHKAVPCSFVPSMLLFLPAQFIFCLVKWCSSLLFSHTIEVSHFAEFLLQSQLQNVLGMKSSSALLQPVQFCTTWNKQQHYIAIAGFWRHYCDWLSLSYC